MIDPRSTRGVARVVPLIAPLPAVAIVAGVVALVVSALLGAAVGRALADWLPLDPSSVDPLEATAGGVGPAIDVAARLSLVVVALLALRAVPASAPPPEVVRRARSVARREASGALRPFQLGEDKAIWGSPGLDAAIVYGEAGRFAVML